MNVTIKNVTIRSIAATIPTEIVDLTELYAIYGTEEVDRIIKMNGISEIRVASEEMCTSDLCEKAARLLLENGGSHTAQDIQGLVFVSQTPDYILPATSALLQHRLGLSNDIVAFDLSNGCPGYIYGLYQAALLVSSGSCNAVLVCAGDVITRYVNQLDKSARMVFGDAGSATLVARGDSDMAFSFMTEGVGAEHLIIKAGGCRYPKDDEQSSMVSVRSDGNMRSDEDIFMNGLEVMNFSVREVPKAITTLLSKTGWQKEEIGLFGFHQANKFMLENLSRIMKLPKGSVPVAMEKTGNTGPASIPLMLAQEHQRLTRENRLQKAIFCGFGVGLSCAAVALELSETQIFDVVER